jgi:nucleotide-binding universal stress UspA family protein
MYKSLYVPVDNSDHSNRAVACAVALGKAYTAKLVGCHVYAAKLHDYRFRQMEYTLPEEYLDEVELERQRKIHDSLITMGLKLISDSYLEGMSRLCRESSLEFEPRMMDGKHHAEILKDLDGSAHDLVVIGALGIGRARDSVIGSVCERVARQCDRDVWVVKHVPEPGEAERDTILVGIDGSPQSFGAFMTAIDLARAFGKKVETIAVYDPYLHYSVFNGIVGVLTEQAAKVFRFEEQNQLHEEIIDTGLAQIYQSHLEVGERMAGEMGIAVKKTLLDGKPFQKILDHARKTNPWLLVLGRIGVHSPKDEKALGSNVENILRGAPCDVLLSTRVEVPRLDVRAEEAVRWTPEAEERMTHVPEQVKGIARTGVLRLALEKGHSVVTSAVIDEAMDRFMPKRASDATKALAEAVALERARSGPVSMCRACGVTATQSGAVRCTVCGAADFEVISREMIEKIAAVEGGLQEETTYDGRKLRWTEEARKGLWTMKNAYQRRRTKARVEKRARMKKLDAITLEFARQVIEEETGAPLEIQVPSAGFTREAALGAPKARPVGAERGEGVPASDGDGGSGGAKPPGLSNDVKLIARDERKNPLISAFDWTDEAVQRIFRVPAGFMRSKTQERIEELARERAAARRAEASGEVGAAIDLALVEEGIEIGKQMMAEMIATYPSPGKSAGAGTSAPVPAGLSAAASGVPAPEAAGSARNAEAAPGPAAPAAMGSGYLNEVSSLSARPID